MELPDAYKSILESFIHAGAVHECKVHVKLVQSEQLTAKNVAQELAGCSGILVAPGFGNRGIEGKFEAIRFARENDIPFLGICLGMQCAVIEFARHVCGLGDADSTEFNPETTHPVIDLMESQEGVTDKGGTMRLGAYPCKLREGTHAREAYGVEMISERHRHRFEFNNEYRDKLTRAGLVIVGTLPDDSLVEVIEVKDHPWFVASQFHPELKSRPNHPHPLFRDFIGAALKMQ